MDIYTILQASHVTLILSAGFVSIVGLIWILIRRERRHDS